jgi:hypothetical protein
MIFESKKHLSYLATFILTGTGIGTLILLSQSLNHYVPLVPTSLPPLVLEGSLQGLKLQNSVYGDVANVDSLAILGLVFGVWLISSALSMN